MYVVLVVWKVPEAEWGCSLAGLHDNTTHASGLWTQWTFFHSYWLHPITSPSAVWTWLDGVPEVGYVHNQHQLRETAQTPGPFVGFSNMLQKNNFCQVSQQLIFQSKCFLDHFNISIPLSTMLVLPPWLIEQHVGIIWNYSLTFQSPTPTTLSIVYIWVILLLTFYSAKVESESALFTRCNLFFPNLLYVPCIFCCLQMLSILTFHAYKKKNKHKNILLQIPQNWTSGKCFIFSILAFLFLFSYSNKLHFFCLH